jgi:outer membrane lipoprotein-sorting protein
MRGKLFLLLLLFSPAHSFAQGGLGADRFGEVIKVLAQCQEAYYRLEDYRGMVLHTIREADGSVREERIEVAFRKPGFLSLRWQSGLYKGTALLARPGWNQGNLLLRLGEWFDFITVSIPATEMGEPFVPAVRDMSDWLTALTSLMQRPVTDRSLRMVEVQTVAANLPEGQVRLSIPAFLIPFRDNAVSTYEFVIERGTGVPTELVLRGAGGEVRQRVTYTDVQVNVGLQAQLFTWEQDKAEPPLPKSGTAIDLQGFIQHWQRRYGEITDYRGTWVAETGDESTVQRMQAAFKFRKPLDLYLQWEPGQGPFQEALFRHGWNNGRMRVRKAFWGIPLIGDIAPDGDLAQWGDVSFLTAFGLHGLVERLQEQVLRGWLRAELHPQFLGVQQHDGRPCYVLAFDFPTGPGRDYASARIVTTWDIAERLLVKYESFETIEPTERLQERHEFLAVQVNTALGDDDFNAANPDYGFLLFRRAPWVDRFLTGRD